MLISLYKKKTFFQEIYCRGFIEIEFQLYTNPQHTDGAGECCHHELSICRLACENTFNLCLNHDENQATDCAAGFYQSRVIDYDDILFPENNIDPKLASSLKFPFDLWNVSVSFNPRILKGRHGRLTKIPESAKHIMMKFSIFGLSTFIMSLVHQLILVAPWSMRRGAPRYAILGVQYR